MENWNGNHYRLKSLLTGAEFEDKGWTLDAPGEDKPSLIRAIYEKKQMNPGEVEQGLYRFADWLPISRRLQGSSAPVTYRSQGLSRALGLNNLYITFSGYYPEKGAFMKTCSFKETEAYSVCGRLKPGIGEVLVVASAGNTARSFARVCSDNNIPLLLCVPEDNLDALWSDERIKPNVKLICSRTGGDYFDAIHLSSLACRIDRFIAEGGAKNVARRDGMGTTVLSAATEIGSIPDYYFQAVGSGTGAIAAWEANLRLLEDGRFGSKKMKLMVSQNEPFIPMVTAWRLGSRNLLPFNDDEARLQVIEICAKVLSNRRPPYSIIGGLFDAMSDAGGAFLTASNDDAFQAAELFLSSEGIDIHPAAAVATATLIKSVREGTIEKHAVIMLNITGGGELRFKNEHQLHYLEPSMTFDLNPDFEEVKERLSALTF
jgi:cysteate synthase